MRWIFMLITVCASSGGHVFCASGMTEGEEIQDFRPSELGEPYAASSPGAK